MGIISAAIGTENEIPVLGRFTLLQYARPVPYKRN